jgi:antitoxin component of MazEF toxin-antitoxin module
MESRSTLTIPLRQHGNSVGLTLPKPFLDALGLAKGAQVDVLLKNGLIEMRPHIESVSIESLMSSYDPNLHNYDDLLPGDVGSEGDI